MDILTKKLLEKTLRTQSAGIGTRLPRLKDKKTETPDEERINCFNCMHFEITGVVSMPYECRAYGFRGKQIPSVVVFSSSGEHCNFFTAKDK